MKLYNTEKELFLGDYKPLPTTRGVSIDELNELAENLHDAIENALINGNDMLALALDMDIRKLNIQIKLTERKMKRNV